MFVDLVALDCGWVKFIAMFRWLFGVAFYLLLVAALYYGLFFCFACCI